MRREPAHLGEISLDFAGMPTRRDKNFPYEYALVSLLTYFETATIPIKVFA